jgi:hypothetical protein
MRSIILGGMLEKIPGADINDRAEIIEYVSSLPYAERISILSHESSLGSLLSDSISQSHTQTQTNTLNSGQDIASDQILSGGGITELENDSRALKAAQAKIEQAKELIAAEVLENLQSHLSFEEIKTSSDTLLADRCRLNEEIVEKTKQMKALVTKELESNARLAEANSKLEAAIIEKNEERTRLLQLAANEAEIERLRKIEEAQAALAAAKAAAEAALKEADERAEATLKQTAEAADLVNLEAANAAEAARGVALQEAEAAKNAAVAEAQAAAKSERLAAVDQAQASQNAAVAEAQAAEDAVNVETNAIYEELKEREKTLSLEVEQAEFGKQVKEDEIPPLPNCSVEVAVVAPEPPAPSSPTSKTGSELQQKFKSFQKQYPQYQGFRSGREGEAPLGGGAKFRQDLDEHFRPLMNERILHESTALKQKLEALYAEKLEELKTLILSRQELGLTEEQKSRIDEIFEAYIAETQTQESWFPDVKLYATYMKKSFEDFLQNSTIDFSNNIERDAIQELEDCLLRVKSFGDRKAALTVETCARSYISKIEDLN